MENTTEMPWETFVTLDAKTSVTQALKKLRKVRAHFAVVTAHDGLQAIVRDKHLSVFADDQQRSLATILSQLPPLLIVSGTFEALDIEDIKHFALVLQLTNAPCLTFYKEKQVVGIVSRRSIARALPLSALPPTSKKGLYGDPVTPPRIYICRKCEKSDPPPPRQLPREGDTIPDCPKHWLHGLMEREDS